MIDIMSVLPVLALAFAGSIVGGMTGYGAGLLLPLLLVPMVGAVPVVPIVALGAIANNISRAVVFRDKIDRGKAVAGTLLALPGAAATAWGYTLLSGRTIQIVIGIVLLAMVVARRVLRHLDRHVSPAAFRSLMAVYGAITGGTTGAGVVLVSILMAAGLTGATVVATDAVITIGLTVVKVAMFAAGGLIGKLEMTLGAAIAVVAIPGATIARSIVERMPVRVHTAILDGVVILGGVVMLWNAWQG